MKIFILPVAQELQPDTQAFRYPPTNQDYGVEQDFLAYLKANPELVSDDENKAAWHYLPVFWTRWFLNHDYGKDGVKQVKERVLASILDDKKTFTICQYDDGPMMDLGKTTVFLSSRKNDQGIDIPLLSTPLKRPFLMPTKKYIGSFVGRLNTHQIRQHVADVLAGESDYYISDQTNNLKMFISIMFKSYVSLCPRGYGGSSFRFYESMQLSVVPYLIGDYDTRPFKKWIAWKQASLYTNNPKNINKEINKLSKKDMIDMGKNAKRIWMEMLRYGKWPRFVIKELELLR